MAGSADPGTDRVGAASTRPDDLEGDADDKYRDEDGLLEASHQRAAGDRLSEGERGQRQPAACGHDAMGVPAAPEVERAPAPREQEGGSIDEELSSPGQMRGEEKEPHDEAVKEAQLEAGAGHEAIEAAFHARSCRPRRW